MEESARLRITPPIEAGDADFLAWLSRHSCPSHGEVPSAPGRGVRRIWPGQPAVASPWVPCAEGCCLVLAHLHARGDTAGQWLRFLVAEFLGDHRLDGWVEVPGVRGRRPVLLVVDGSEVFEGEIEDDALEDGALGQAAIPEPRQPGYRPTFVEPDPSRERGHA